MGKIGVVRAGPLTSVQDLGRPGYRALGVSRGGALDLRAAQIANLLVGNPTEIGLLEITLGAVQLRFADARRVAWCGGEFTVQIADTNVPAGRPAFVRPGELLSRRLPCGCRACSRSEAGSKFRRFWAVARLTSVPPLVVTRVALHDGDELQAKQPLLPRNRPSRPWRPTAVGANRDAHSDLRACAARNGKV